ncbi:MAG: hypothetical protein ABI615_01745 [Chthoniobacterales bacterium]
MPDNEVKIHISADAETAKVEDLKKRIQDLHRAADAYDKKGGMQNAAGSARSEATGLERELTRLTRDRAAVGKAAAKEETKELREHIALRKVGASRVHSVAQTGMNIAQGENPATAAMSGLMNFGSKFGVVGTITAAVAAATVGAFAMVSQQADDVKRRRLDIAAEDGDARYRMNRNRGVYGSSGALGQQALQDEEEMARRTAAKPGLEEKARVKWYAPSTWTWGGLRQNEGQKELEDNQEKNSAQNLRRAEERKAQQEKFRNEEGGLELQGLRGRAKRSQAGQQEAFAAEMGAKWLGKYKEAIAASGDDRMSKEIADLTVQNEVRDRQAQAGAGLVDARSGGGEIAAAARWGMQTFNMDKLAGEMSGLHQTVINSNQQNQLKDQAK